MSWGYRSGDLTTVHYSNKPSSTSGLNLERVWEFWLVSTVSDRMVPCGQRNLFSCLVEMTVLSNLLEPEASKLGTAAQIEL